MMLSTMIETLQRILKEEGDYPVSVRVDYNNEILMAYLWDEDGTVIMRLDGRLPLTYELPK